MLVSYVRTLFLLFFAVAAVRLMGKRQIGQLQPAELVITILLSEVAATPMQDSEVSVWGTVVAILVLAGAEILVSSLSMKSIKIRRLLQGNSVLLIKEGRPDLVQMKNLRFTFDDLLESLRQKDVFDISDVLYAVAETDGSVSVLLKSGREPLTKEDVNIKTEEKGFPYPLIMDGKIIKENFANCGITEKMLMEELEKQGKKLPEIMLLTRDGRGKTNITEKDIKI